jgi:glutamate N-acetyltransferase/amino-acid N-acetyltransferase
VAEQLGCPEDEVLICQTGLIGIPFPLAAAKDGIATLATHLHSSLTAGQRAAEAIMTTDTFAKQTVIGRDGFTVAAMAKGAAMLAPDMATMLCVLVTDADFEPAGLAESLRIAVAGSFNSLDVDGATSTNDTVILVSTGAAGRVDDGAFVEALSAACQNMADAMAFDAEGATKAVRITVRGAESDDEAHRAARKVATSQLVKCSFNGEDPYWGRVLSEVATAGVACDPARTTISYGGVVVSAGGVAVEHDAVAVAAHMHERWLTLEVDLGLGSGVGSILTTDLGHGYIDENRTTS